MKLLKSLKEAQELQENGATFIHIHRVKEDVWEVYEPGDEVPPEYIPPVLEN
jgi:hypothetical protein